MRVRWTPLFASFWEEKTGTGPDEAGKLTAAVLVFLSRAGGPPPTKKRVPLVTLKASRRNRSYFYGRQWDDRIILGVSMNPKHYGPKKYYFRKPLLPFYGVNNVREALVAGIAHEGSHWMDLGLLSHRYFKNRRAKNGSEFICEIMAVTALCHFCRGDQTVKETFEEL